MSQRSEGPSPGDTMSSPANGTSQPEPVRRSWRPCQMLNQDGEVVHHHHQHPAPQHRSRRRPQHHQPAPGHRPDPADPSLAPTPHPRPAVSRYRRHGDPNPRLRARQRPPVREELKDTSGTSRAETPPSQTDGAQCSISIRTPGGDVCLSLAQERTEEERDGHGRGQATAEESDPTPEGCQQSNTDDSGGNSSRREAELFDQSEGDKGRHVPISSRNLQNQEDKGEGLKAHREGYGAQGEELSGEREGRIGEGEELIEQGEGLIGQRGELIGEGEGLIGMREELIGQGEGLIGQREELIGEGEGLIGQREELIGQGEGLIGQREELIGQGEELSEEREGLIGQGEELIGQEEELSEEREGLSGQSEELSGHDEEMIVQGDELIGQSEELIGQEEELIGQRKAAEEEPAPESEITDLCSDTESAASLSLDGPLHSPPPLHSPTPPSSPDVPHFPQLDHFVEDPSPLPTRDTPTPPGDRDHSDLPPEDDDEASSQSYPQTYADFYSQSHHKPYPEPKAHPNCFPEPLRTAYPVDPPRPEPRGSRPSHSPASSCQAPQHRAVPSLPPESSVGCRLHHYDGQSDGEGSDRSPMPRARRQGVRRGDGPGKRASAGHSRSGASPGEAPEDRTPAETGPRGDAISLAIRGIKEAIEEVKTRAVRSPYTPDQPEEPIWVMRQESSPTEEAGSAGQPSPCDSLSQCSPSAQDPVSPVRTPQRSQRDGPRQSHAVPPHEAQQRAPLGQQQPSPQEIRQILPTFPTFVDVPGPCDPEDLIDGIIFAATYMGCTHLLSERTPSKSARMQQAQEAMSRVRAAQKQAKNRKKGADGDTSTVEVDLFMSTQRIKVLNADTQESLMDLPLRTISYIADIGNMVVLIARGKLVRSSRSAQDQLDSGEDHSPDHKRVYRMICHVFESEDAQLIAQSIGQSFSVAYQEFLRANGIDPEDLSQREYSDLLSTQDMYNEDLIHFSKSENCRDVYIEKQKGEMLGVVIVESGWGSILPTVIIASMMHSGPAEKSGRLNIGDQIMTVNGTSLVGLPLNTCQSIIKGLKSQCRIKMNIVRCPPVTMVLIRRPDLRYQLGFSVQNGIICSLMRGGIAERGGVRVGHRIIEINSQSVVATPHEKIVQILSNAMGEIHMKTMPAAMYRLLTAQEQPVYI